MGVRLPSARSFFFKTLNFSDCFSVFFNMVPFLYPLFVPSFCRCEFYEAFKTSPLPTRREFLNQKVGLNFCYGYLHKITLNFLKF